MRAVPRSKDRERGELQGGCRLSFGKGLGAPILPRTLRSPHAGFALMAEPQGGPSTSGAVGSAGAPRDPPDRAHITAPRMSVPLSSAKQNPYPARSEPGSPHAGRASQPRTSVEGSAPRTGSRTRRASPGWLVTKGRILQPAAGRCAGRELAPLSA